MPEKNNIFHPSVQLLFGAFVISFSSVLVKLSDVPPAVSAFYRVFFGALFLIAACFIRGEFRKRGLKKNSMALLCGFIFALDLWAWHESISYIGPGLSTLLANCQVFILSAAGSVPAQLQTVSGSGG